MQCIDPGYTVPKFCHWFNHWTTCQVSCCSLNIFKYRHPQSIHPWLQQFTLAGDLREPREEAGCLWDSHRAGISLGRGRGSAVSEGTVVRSTATEERCHSLIPSSFNHTNICISSKAPQTEMGVRGCPKSQLLGSSFGFFTRSLQQIKMASVVQFLLSNRDGVYSTAMLKPAVV